MASPPAAAAPIGAGGAPWPGSPATSRPRAKPAAGDVDDDLGGKSGSINDNSGSEMETPPCELEARTGAVEMGPREMVPSLRTYMTATCFGGVGGVNANECMFGLGLTTTEHVSQLA